MVTCPKPKRVSVVQICLRLELQRQVRHADVGGLGEHRGEVDGAEVVLVLEGRGADLDEARDWCR